MIVVCASEVFTTSNTPSLARIRQGPGIPTFLPSARWMASLFPKALYLTPRGQAMNRFGATCQEDLHEKERCS
jgi:hypothetical protein